MSYADMITLLMCFFIIFVSVSEPRKEQISAITSGLAGKFGTVDLSTPFQSTYQALQAVAQEHKLFKDFAVEKTTNSIDMELAAGAFYKPGTAELNPDKIPALTELVAALKKVNFLDFTILIESHTSDVPINTAMFPSNWELSTARSARMVRFFIEQGINPVYLKAVGYADTRPEVPNLDINGHAIGENRQRNERVTIKLERDAS